MKCMDPVGVYKPGYNDTCKIVTDFKTTIVKAKYTCKVGICTYNCWVCTTHKMDNKVLLDEIKNTMKTRGLNMSFTAVRLNVGRARDKAGRGPPSSSCSL